MHFYYLDESGCTGTNLADVHQPLFVLGGVSVKDKGWNETQKRFDEILSCYFDGVIPENFELHTEDLLSPNGDGSFQDHDRERRNQLAKDFLAILGERGHHIHFFAIDKQKLNDTPALADLNYGGYDIKAPYLVAYDYLLTHINSFVKEKLGVSARGMFIMDDKDQFRDDIEAITKFRRFQGTIAHRIKWIVEFSYPVDSKKNPMIQLSDLIVFCVRRFLEIESGYRDNYPQEAKQFFAECYQIIDSRNQIKTLIEREGRGMDALNDYLKAVQAKPNRRWKQRYNL